MENIEKKYRLLTQSNLDGIISAIFLHKLALINEVSFVKAQEFKEGKFPTSDKDITVNLPFRRGVHQAYDYHDNSTLPDMIINEYHILDTTMHSASQLIYAQHEDALNDIALKKLVNIANKETSNTLTTKERMSVYAEYEKTFEHTLALA